MAPRTTEQYETIREEKKNLIMQTALEHFARNGYHATTISHIAKHAGISKGLLYNYFESKEALLKEIIFKSLSEIYKYFDINRDGFLTEEEFEFFVKQVFRILGEKKIFWQLFFQLLMQNEVREQFLKNADKLFLPYDSRKNESAGNYILDIAGIFNDYFARKKEKKGPDYDPELELTMFMYTLKGLAVTFVFSDELYDRIHFEKTLNKIIELYK